MPADPGPDLPATWYRPAGCDDFRAYLLPRLPVRGVAAVVVSSALFTAQHYWQPYNWLLILVLELILTAFVVRLRRYRIGIVLHVLANSVGILLGLLG